MKQKQCIFSFLFPASVQSLKSLCLRHIINVLPHRRDANRLELPDTLKSLIKKRYAEFVEFKPVIIQPYDPEGEWYALIEFKIDYGVIYSKNFFGTIFFNPWIEKDFITLDKVIHFVSRLFVKFPKNPKKGRKYLHVCAHCLEEEGKISKYNYHYCYRGPSDALFQILFKNPTAWCQSCKQSPLYSIYTPNECHKRYGTFPHECCQDPRVCTMCYEGERLSRVWLEDFE